jgi:hypothetical protein
MRMIVLSRIDALFATDHELIEAGYPVRADIIAMSDEEMLDLYEEMVGFQG